MTWPSCSRSSSLPPTLSLSLYLSLRCARCSIDRRALKIELKNHGNQVHANRLTRSSIVSFSRERSVKTLEATELSVSGLNVEGRLRNVGFPMKMKGKRNAARGREREQGKRKRECFLENSITYKKFEIQSSLSRARVRARHLDRARTRTLSFDLSKGSPPLRGFPPGIFDLGQTWPP